MSFATLLADTQSKALLNPHKVFHLKHIAGATV